MRNSIFEFCADRQSDRDRLNQCEKESVNRNRPSPCFCFFHPEGIHQRCGGGVPTSRSEASCQASIVRFQPNNVASIGLTRSGEFGFEQPVTHRQRLGSRVRTRRFQVRSCRGRAADRGLSWAWESTGGNGRPTKACPPPLVRSKVTVWEGGSFSRESLSVI